MPIETYLWDFNKPASQALMDALAAKQKKNPELKINVFLARTWSPVQNIDKDFENRAPSFQGKPERFSDGSPCVRVVVASRR